MLIYVKRSEGNPIDPQLEALLGRIKQERVIYQFRHLGELLPLFTDHLRSAVSRMVMLLQKLGEPAPASRGGGVLKARWERERKAIEGIGLPGDPAAAAGLARALAANS
jgi:hypothetical protein